MLHENNIVSIDCGSDTDEDDLLIAHREFSKLQGKDVYYGYISGSSYNQGKADSDGMATSRNGELEYKFILNEKQKVIACCEFRDVCSQDKGNRVFDVTIVTDSQNIVANDIDVYSIGENDPVKLLVPLQETGMIDIRWFTVRGDVPFCNVIRLLKQ